VLVVGTHADRCAPNEVKQIFKSLKSKVRRPHKHRHLYLTFVFFFFE
jgi:hypothetical protein